MGRQADTHAEIDRPKDTQTGGQAGKDRDRQTDRHRAQTDCHTDNIPTTHFTSYEHTHTHKQHTHKHTSPAMNTHTHTHTHTHTQPHPPTNPTPPALRKLHA